MHMCFVMNWHPCREMDRVNYSVVADIKDPLISKVWKRKFMKIHVLLLSLLKFTLFRWACTIHSITVSEDMKLFFLKCSVIWSTSLYRYHPFKQAHSTHNFTTKIFEYGQPQCTTNTAGRLLLLNITRLSTQIDLKVLIIFIQVQYLVIVHNKSGLCVFP